MKLRKGRAKSILRSSIDSALLAVEVYNKPRATFRTQAYVSLMVMAWTRLLHAYFYKTKGDRFYYKKKGKFEVVDGEKKAWDLQTCIRRYGQLTDAVKANLEFFIGLRNKIEHRHIEKREFDALIFGECQSLLLNYEALVIELFGDEFALGESLAYSLQFSSLRTDEQTQAHKRALSAEIKNVRSYIERYRSSLSDSVFEAQEFSIKLLQVPRIANTNRNDLAIEFVRWDSLGGKDRETYRKLDAIVKSKVIRVEAVNVGKLKPGKVVSLICEKSSVEINHHDHKCLYVILGVRPAPGSAEDPFNTDTRYCHYDELHDDYVYSDAWVDCAVRVLKKGRLTKLMWRNAFRQGRRYAIDNVV